MACVVFLPRATHWNVWPHHRSSFPATPPSTSPQARRERYVTALYDFTASRSDEMDLQRGAVYRVVAERGQWYVGEDYSGCRGEFPATYVEHGSVSAKHSHHACCRA